MAMLTTYKRHLKNCEHRSEGRKYRRCRCPIWVDGFLEGREIRKSLDTANWEKAQDIVREMEATGSEPKPVQEPLTIQTAEDKFLADTKAQQLSEATVYKYGVLFKQLKAFAERRGLRFLIELDLPMLDDF